MGTVETWALGILVLAVVAYIAATGWIGDRRNRH
jgi:hypothetical protein